MNALEANALLTKAEQTDSRIKPTVEACETWAALLHDVSLAEASAALLVFQRERTDWLLPAHLLELVRLERRRKADEERRQLQLTREPEAVPEMPDKAELERVFQESLAEARAQRALTGQRVDA